MTPSTTFLLILILTFAYSVVRYHVFGDVPWAQMPLYVMNKAVSWSGLTLLALAYLRRDKPAARDLGVLGLFLTGAHIAMSFSIMSPAYYAKLYEGGRLTAWGEGAILAGVGAAVVLALPALGTLPGVREALGDARWLRWQRAGYWALALTASHCALLGGKGWFAPQSWPGGLPPITLLSFLMAVAPLAWRLRRRTTG